MSGFDNGRWHRAAWRPLGPQTEDALQAQAAILHTIVGGLRGAEAVFKPGGYDGVEAHFGIGGRWDGIELDGQAWQWQDINHTADAQYAGNEIGIAIEHSDGGNPHHPFTTKQLKTDIALIRDICRTRDLPCHLMKHPRGQGVGYHELFPEWNTTAHVCPGPVREGQIRTIIIPKARALLLGQDEPHVKVHHDPSHSGKNALLVDGILGSDTIAAMQNAIGADVDGVMGPTTRRHLQKHYRLDTDGSISRQDVKAMQAHLYHDRFYGGMLRRDAVNGYWRRPTTKAIQRALNAGRF